MIVAKDAIKNPNTGGLEIKITFTADEIDLLNGIIRLFNKGDKDDPKQQQILETFKEEFYQARRKVKP